MGQMCDTSRSPHAFRGHPALGLCPSLWSLPPACTLLCLVLRGQAYFAPLGTCQSCLRPVVSGKKADVIPLDKPRAFRMQ